MMITGASVITLDKGWCEVIQYYSKGMQMMTMQSTLSHGSIKSDLTGIQAKFIEAADYAVIIAAVVAGLMTVCCCANAVGCVITCVRWAPLYHIMVCFEAVLYWCPC